MRDAQMEIQNAKIKCKINPKDADMDDAAKIYGLCLERLKYQIKNAKQRVNGNGNESILLESYNTAELDDIIDILELYDLEENTYDALKNKLDDLAYTVSILTHETLFFGFTGKGFLGLFLALKEKPLDPSSPFPLPKIFGRSLGDIKFT